MSWRVGDMRLTSENPNFPWRDGQLVQVMRISPSGEVEVMRDVANLSLKASADDLLVG